MPIFEALAAACAPAVALDLLAGIAMVESGVRTLSIRDGAQSGLVGSSGEGVAVVVGAAATLTQQADDMLCPQRKMLV